MVVPFAADGVNVVTCSQALADEGAITGTGHTMMGWVEIEGELDRADPNRQVGRTDDTTDQVRYPTNDAAVARHPGVSRDHGIAGGVR